MPVSNEGQQNYVVVDDSPNVVEVVNPENVLEVYTSVGLPGAKGNKGDQGDPGQYEVSETAPSAPFEGMIWWNSTTGKKYLRYDNYWVGI